MTAVRLERRGAIRHLVLDAPQRRNALDQPMLAELGAAVAEVAADHEARALVISGAGRSFCAGADVSSLFGDTTRPTAEIRGDLKGIYRSFLGVRDLPIPTIASVQGHAVGAGVNIALACDVVIAGRDARFLLNFAGIGLHPGGGSSWLLTRRLGSQRALALLLSAGALDADAALQAGLVAECADDPLARALELAADWATCDAELVRDIKRAVQLAETSPLGTVLEFESWAQASSVASATFRSFIAEFNQAHGVN